MRIQAQDKVTVGRKSSVKLFIGAYIQAMGPNRPTTDSRPKFGGEITSDQPDDYKSRLFATYQGLDDGHKREKSTPIEKIGPHPTKGGQYNLIEATLDLLQVGFNLGG